CGAKSGEEKRGSLIAQATTTLKNADSDLLWGHNQYVGRSLKVNGSFCRDTYRLTQIDFC
ncbi:hypothetical protein AAGO69_26470, partial [Klebsiella pneumoniae]